MALKKTEDLIRMGDLPPPPFLLVCTDSTVARGIFCEGWGAGKDTQIALRAINRLRRLRQLCKVEFLWVPAHTGIHGNERADFLAKEGAKLSSILLSGGGAPPSPHNYQTQCWPVVNLSLGR